MAGTTTLTNGLRWHVGQLDEEMRRLRNTRALCKRLIDEGRELETLHTGEVLEEIEDMEARGEGLYGVARELVQRVRRILPPMPVYQIEPKDVIAAPADVDRALIDFAVDRKLDLTILRGNSYVPVVILDGQKLWGFCRPNHLGFRILYLYRNEEDSQYDPVGKVTMKRILNLFKWPKK